MAGLPLADASIHGAVELWLANATHAALLYGPIAAWNTSAVTDMAYLFCSDQPDGRCKPAAADFNESLAGWDTSRVTTMEYMFSGAVSFDQPLSLDTSSVASMAYMFSNASAFDQPLNFDTSSVTTMEDMFSYATSFSQSLSFDTSSVTTMQDMFRSAIVFNQAVEFDTSKVTDMDSMFRSGRDFNQPVNFDTSSVTDMDRMFYAARAFNQSLNFDTSSVTSMQGMLNFAVSFTQPLSFNTSRVTDMQGMFANNIFNFPINFDTSSVTNMRLMFKGNPVFNQLLDFDTSRVKNMGEMFMAALAFNQPLNFITSSVTTMDAMFREASSFNQPLSFDTGSVTTMEDMFNGASAFNQPLSFDSSQVTSMQNMFRGASSFDQPLSFNVSSVTNMTGMFELADQLSDCNKAKIHASFASNVYWPYEWSSYGGCPPSAPPPPATPTPSAGPIASISGDPHLRGAHGDRADFKGEDGGVYVVLSTHDLSLAVGVEHSTFFTPHSKLWVHGSWIRHAYWVVRTSRGRLLHIHLNAHHPSYNGSRLSTSSVIDGVHVSFQRKALEVRTFSWRTIAKVTRGMPHPGHLRMNIEIQPLYNVDLDRNAPHGLLGQTYDGDKQPVHGNRDRYQILDDGRPTWIRHTGGGLVTTRAKAEGAIEGSIEMYRIYDAFETDFAFSRFGRPSGGFRNVSALLNSPHS